MKLNDSVLQIANLFLFRESARETPQRESAAKEYTALSGRGAISVDLKVV